MTNRYQKIQDHQDYVKDSFGGAIINSNKDAFQAHLERKREKQRICQLENKLEHLEASMCKIESLLEQLINK